jgi:hypothetical protein
MLKGNYWKPNANALLAKVQAAKFTLTLTNIHYSQKWNIWIVHYKVVGYKSSAAVTLNTTLCFNVSKMVDMGIYVQYMLVILKCSLKAEELIQKIQIGWTACTYNDTSG